MTPRPDPVCADAVLIIVATLDYLQSERDAISRDVMFTAYKFIGKEAVLEAADWMEASAKLMRAVTNGT